MRRFMFEVLPGDTVQHTHIVDHIVRGNRERPLRRNGVQQQLSAIALAEGKETLLILRLIRRSCLVFLRSGRSRTVLGRVGIAEPGSLASSTGDALSHPVDLRPLPLAMNGVT